MPSTIRAWCVNPWRSLATTRLISNHLRTRRTFDLEGCPMRRSWMIALPRAEHRALPPLILANDPHHGGLRKASVSRLLGRPGRGRGTCDDVERGGGTCSQSPGGRATGREGAATSLTGSSGAAGGRSDRRSSPCSTRPRSRSRTSLARPRSHRLRQGRAVRSSSQR